MIFSWILHIFKHRYLTTFEKIVRIFLYNIKRTYQGIIFYRYSQIELFSTISVVFCFISFTNDLLVFNILYYRLLNYLPIFVF